MGLHDTEEQLDAARAQSVLDERQIAALTRERDGLRRDVDRLRRTRDAVRAVWRRTRTMTLNPGARDALAEIRAIVGPDPEDATDEDDEQ